MRRLLRVGANGARRWLAEAAGPGPSWITVDLNGSFPVRTVPRRLLALPPDLSQRDLSLESFAALTDSLAAASWLEGVVLRWRQPQLGLAGAFALRLQLERLRAAGKRSVAYVPALGTVDYYLAVAADEIVLPEGAELSVRGMALSATYLGEGLQRLGVGFERLAIAEYKTAFETFARDRMSSSQREQLEAFLDDACAAWCQAVAAGRRVTEEAARGWLEDPPVSAAAARARGLIDDVLYEDELLDEAPRPLAATRRHLAPRRVAGERGVAVVELSGAIVPGASRRFPVPLPLLGDELSGSETVTRALRAAARDEDAAAVVLYVDSGGGSALASDLIWREAARLARIKPLVAVMGPAAASGGYYVLTHARHVVASPFTVTGSIGVVAARLVLEELFDRHGLHEVVLQRGRFAAIDRSRERLSDDEREYLQRGVEATYQRFVARVADGRRMAPERVDALGRGRIWSGAAALRLGLVDEIGDMEVGIARARELAGLSAAAPVWNVRPPSKPVPPVGTDGLELLRRLAWLGRERQWLLAPLVRGPQA